MALMFFAAVLPMSVGLTAPWFTASPSGVQSESRTGAPADAAHNQQSERVRGTILKFKQYGSRFSITVSAGSDDGVAVGASVLVIDDLRTKLRGRGQVVRVAPGQSVCNIKMAPSDVPFFGAVRATR